VRGKGLLLGVEIVKDQRSNAPAPEEAKKIVNEALKRRLIITTTGTYGCIIRLTPSLVLSEEEALRFLQIFEDSVKATVRSTC
jgi:4-aminobutyrate aminotransferase-like enzyme